MSLHIVDDEQRGPFYYSDRLQEHARLRVLSACFCLYPCAGLCKNQPNLSCAAPSTLNRKEGKT